MDSQSHTRRRYIIIGAGAVGGTMGGRLAGAGHDVVLVARGPHLEALQSQGLQLLGPSSRQVLRIPVAAGPSELTLGPRDVLVLAVKSQDTVGLLDAWAAQPVAGGGLASERLPLVCAQNGVENERTALRWFSRVYGLCVWLPAVHLQPGVVAMRSAPVPGSFVLGRYPRGVDELATAMVDDFAASGFAVRASDDVMRWKYGKLLGNIFNAFDAILAPKVDFSSLLADAVAEGKAVLDAAGIEYTSTAEDEQLRAPINIQDVPGLAEAGSSSWQSLAKGSRSLEIDYLNGEIVLLGRLHGIATPHNRALQRINNQLARQGAEPRRLSVEQVQDAVQQEMRAAAEQK